MKSELKTIKFQMMLSESETKRIDDWGFAHRLRSRAETIRRLCQVGMSVGGASDKQKRPSDISQEHFDQMLEAMLAYRNAMIASRNVPDSLPSRSPERREAMANVEKAQRSLWTSFFPDDDEDIE